MKKIAWYITLSTVSLLLGGTFNQVSTAAGQTSGMRPVPAQIRLSAADEAKLNTIIAQHQKLRSQLPAEYRVELDRLSAQVRKQLFAEPLPIDLWSSTAQIVRKIISGLTTSEAKCLAVYALDSIASNTAADKSGQPGLTKDTRPTQETWMRFIYQYLRIQEGITRENRQYSMISNIMKVKHDTIKSSIHNIR